MSENKQYDVFISYSSSDRVYVEPIVNVLRARGLRIFFDRDIGAGLEWLTVLQEALLASRMTVVFITKESLKSPWVQYEMSGALTAAAQSPEGHHVLPVLLKETTYAQLPLFLQGRQPLDRSREDLNDVLVPPAIGESLADAIKVLVPDIGFKPLYLPFIVCSMNRQEATDLLINGSAECKAQDKFNKIIEELETQKGYTRDKLVELYADARDDWRSPLCPQDPVTGETMTIQATIREVVRRISPLVLKEVSGAGQAEVKNPTRFTLCPRYFSEAVLSADYNKRREAYNDKDLSGRGCVLVVDSLSLFHSHLFDYFMQALAQLDSKTISIVAPLPYLRPLESIDSLLEDAMQQMMTGPYSRFDSDLDIFCEFGVSHPRALRRWLSHVLPKAAEAFYSQRPQADKMNMFVSQMQGES